MNNILVNNLANIEFLKPQTHNNMTVVGITTNQINNIDFLSLKKGIEMGLVEISEISESGSVPELKVKNMAVTPLLLLDGEELMGAKQNRILNTSILVPEESEIIVPVSCTEAGRWSFKSKHFSDSGHLASSRVRRGKATSVNNSLLQKKTYQSNQSEVWESIRQTEKNLKVESSTGALRDAYTSCEDDIDDYLIDFNYTKGQNGSIILINGEVMGMEIVYNTYRYKDYHEKIMQSYILDSIQHTTLTTNSLNDTEALNLANDFVKTIPDCKVSSFESVGYGQDQRFENKDSLGSALIYKDEIIHAVFFKKLDPKADFGSNGGVVPTDIIY